MYKHYRLFLLFVLTFFAIPIVLADSDCASNDPNYYRAEDLLAIGQDNSENPNDDPNYFRAEDLLAIREDRSENPNDDPNYYRAEDYLAIADDNSEDPKDDPNYYRAEDYLALGKYNSDKPIVLNASDHADQKTGFNKNTLPQLDDQLASDSFLLPVSEVEPTSPTADTLRQAAHDFFGEAQFEYAIEQYKAILAYEPDNVSAHFRIGYAYYALENPAQAVIYLQQALDQQPYHLYAQYLLAMSYSMLDMSDEARDLMSTIYGKGQYDGAYPLALGHVFRNLGYIESAGAEFYTWILQHETIRIQVPANLDGSPVPLVMDKGVVYEIPFLAMAGDAVQISVESHVLNPTPIDPLIVVLNASGIAVAGDDDSGELFDATLRFMPSKTGVYTLLISHAGGKSNGDLTLTMTGTGWTADMYRSLAHEAIQHGLYQDGIDLIGTAIALDGGQYHDYMTRAYAYRQIADPTTAIADYYLAFALSPYPEEVYANIGQTYRIMGNLDKATIAYRNALTVNPLLHAVRCDLGMTYVVQGEYMRGVQQFDIVLGYDITDSCAWSNRDATLQMMRELDTPTVSPVIDMVTLGYQHQANGKLFSAANAFMDALESNPSLDDVRCELGIIFTEWGNYLAALEHFDIVLSHNSANICAQTQRSIAVLKSYAPMMLMTAQDYVYLGNLHIAQGNWELGASAYSTALRFEPTLTDVRCQLGMIYITLEDYPSAIQQFDMLLTQNPTDICAMENRRSTLRIMTQTPTDVSSDYIEAMQAYSDVLLARDVYDYPLPTTITFSGDDEIDALYSMSMMLGSDALMREAQARHEAGNVWLASALLDRYIDEYYATMCSNNLSVLADEYRRHGYTVMANMLTLKAIGDSTC